MSDLTAWYLPGQPRGFFVLRSPAGKLWAFPVVAGAWARGLRFRVEREPTCEPMPPTVTRDLAHLLGVPGYGALDAEDTVLAALENLEEWRALEPDAVGVSS